jgi:hypothetical protein
MYKICYKGGEDQEGNMKANVRLDGEDRNFFTLVTQAILTNPFMGERAEVLAQTVPDFTPDSKRPEFKLLSILPVLDDRIGQLERKGLSQIKHFSKEDRQLLKDSFLLQVYLQLLHKFDELIRNQLSLGETPAEVPFAQQVIAQLKARGFLDHECLRYLALFYQLRRAYYFISQALVGDTPSMKELRLSLWNSVFTSDVRTYDQHLWNRMEDFSTILLGETGTGKGSAAAAIGRSGFIPFDRKKGRFTENFTETFIAINLSQYPESLITTRVCSNVAAPTARCFWMRSATSPFLFKSNCSRFFRNAPLPQWGAAAKSVLRAGLSPPPISRLPNCVKRVIFGMIFSTVCAPTSSLFQHCVSASKNHLRNLSKW